MDPFALTGEISAYIAKNNPRVRYFSRDIEDAKGEYTEDELLEMRELGLLPQDFETYYVTREFLASIGVTERADGSYLLELFRAARRLDADEFRSNPYIKAVMAKDVRKGNILLTTAEYRRGELLLYDMPDLSARIPVPKLGFFDRTVRFPTVYEGEMPWMSVCPSEINSMKGPIEAAHGRVLVLGLGLGYYPFMITEKENVSEITVVELQKNVIDVFESVLLPQFPNKAKIRILCSDAVTYLESVRDGDYDFCFADIWEGAVDGADAYKKIKPHEARLPSTEFAYWIEREIRAYLEAVS